MTKKKKGITGFFRKVMQRFEKDSQGTNNSATAANSSNDISQQSDSIQNLAPVMVSRAVQVDLPMPGEIQRLPPAHVRPPLNSGFNMPYVSHNQRRTLDIERLREFESQSVDSLERQTPTRPMKPMMSDHSFYLLPEYTGSSSESLGAMSKINRRIQKHKAGNDDSSLSTMSSVHRGLEPIQPPNQINEGEDGSIANKTQSSSSYVNAASTEEDVFLSSPLSMQARRLTKSNPPAVPDLSGRRRRYAFNHGPRSSPTAAIRKFIRENQNTIPYELVPPRGSSRRAAQIRGIFSPSTFDRIIPKKHTPTILRATADTGPIGLLDYNSRESIASSAQPYGHRTDRTTLTPAVDVHQSSSSSLPHPISRNPSRIMVSLPPSRLDRIFDSSSPNDAPPIPRVFQRNAPPRVPDIFRKNLLKSPPVSSFRPNPHLPRNEGMINLHDKISAQQQMNQSYDSEQSSSRGTSGEMQSGNVHLSGASSMSTDREDHGDSIYQANSVAKVKQVARNELEDHDEGSDDAEWVSDDTDGKFGRNGIDPYDRSGAQNRSGFYIRDV